MSGGVSGYAGLNARVRVMYSTLLDANTFAELSEASDLVSLVGLLKRTAYGPYLESLKEKEFTSHEIALHIKNRLADAYQSVIHTAPEIPATYSCSSIDTMR